MSGRAAGWVLPAFLAALMIVNIAASAFAAQPAKKAVAKEISGRVTGKTKYYIAITYSEDKAAQKEYEMLIPLDGNETFDHVKSLDQINEGDTISVQYEEEEKPTVDGQKVFKKGKTISFVKAAPVQMESTVLGAQ